MNDDILNIEQAIEFLGVSEKTLIKLLREEHIPARKIGREWRFSREALIHWLASGDSIDYINQNDRYMISEDVPGTSAALFGKIGKAITTVMEHDNNIKAVLQELERDIIIPQEATLRISYKQQREVEKLEFKIFWEQREESKLEANPKYFPPGKRIE
jgi:excisionase family DNA binding protein